MTVPDSIMSALVDLAGALDNEAAVAKTCDDFELSDNLEVARGQLEMLEAQRKLARHRALAAARYLVGLARQEGVLENPHSVNTLSDWAFSGCF